MKRTAALALLTLCACASSLPPRLVIEHDLGEFAYRRYQRSLETEIAIADNPATGHTAAYLKRGAHEVAVVSAYVTDYAHAKALTAEARAALANMPGYTLTPETFDGEHVWLLAAGAEEHWCIWVSGKRLVKLGAPAGSEFPHAIVSAYLALYPSDLDERGHARANAASAGEPSAAADTPEGVPASLRESAPR
jgi:hypothetical protein